MLGIICLIGVWVSEHCIHAGLPPQEAEKQWIEYRDTLAAGEILKALDPNPSHLISPIELEDGQHHYTITSSLDAGLQKYVTKLLRRSQTQKAGVVVLDSEDGRVLAMVSYDKNGAEEDICLKADFPAASLFKIICAAAAMETSGFGPNKELYYRGSRHTLYHSQLHNKVDRWTQRTTLKRAFASSINPVFGKLGIFTLGRETMADYAERFYFNRKIPFELPVGISALVVPEHDFGVAEIASGFNKKTVISPLHAALIASVVANKGVMICPWLIERVQSESGELIYQRGPAVLTKCLDDRTAKDMKVLMHDTVVYGTCSKAFRPLRQNKAFKTIELGAKTGTINDQKDQFKFDWLAAYALSKNGKKSICIAVLGVHGEKLGIRANELGRYIINYYMSS